MERLEARRYFDDMHFRLSVRRLPRHGAIREPHSHDFEELVVILDGSAIHQIGREKYEIAAGDVFVVLGGMSHCYPTCQQLSLINILYDSASLRLPRYDVGELPGYHALFRIEPRLRQQQRFQNRLKLGMDELGRLTSIVAEMERELRERRAGFRYMATMHFMRLTGFLSRAYASVTANEPKPITQVSELLGYMEQNFAKPLTITDLAEQACMSETTLFRTFRSVVGRSPVDYLIRLRISKAGQLLQSGNLCIGEISEAVGFQDSNYFSRQFRAVTGRSPRAYRQQRR